MWSNITWERNRFMPRGPICHQRNNASISAHWASGSVRALPIFHLRELHQRNLIESEKATGSGLQWWTLALSWTTREDINKLREDVKRQSNSSSKTNSFIDFDFCAYISLCMYLFAWLLAKLPSTTSLSTQLNWLHLLTGLSSN